MQLKHLVTFIFVVIITNLYGNVTISLDKASAIYNLGETVKFTVSPDTAQKATKLKAILSLDGGKYLETKTFLSNKGIVITGKLDKPGVLQLKVTGVLANKKINIVSGAAIKPDKIIQGKAAPKDFDEFWQSQIAKAQKLPLDFKIEKLANYSTSSYTSYLVSCASINGRVYGYLTIPVKKHKVPMLIGIEPSGSGRNMPVLKQFGNRKAVLWLNVHNYSPSLPTKERNAAYKKVNTPTVYYLSKNTNRETYYYYRVLLGFNKLVNHIAKLPEIDANKIGAFGVSQGGGLALMLTSLNSYIKGVCVAVPALCDHHAFNDGRYPGWPRLVNQKNPATSICAQYYDVANFCKNIKVPVWVVAGLADTTCPPSSICAAFNAIASKEKYLKLEPNMTHSVSRPSYGKNLADLRVMLNRLSKVK